MTPDVVEAAIARVLDAEHAARDCVAQAGVAAATMTEEARSAARALAQRTERRIRAVRAAFEERTTAEVGALDATAAATNQQRAPTAEELVRVDAATARLAALLTGSGT